MTMTVKRKMYVGVSRFMFPVPRALSAIGMGKSVAGARAKADLLSEEERRIHHFVVRELAVAKAPVTPELIGERLEIPVERVVAAVDKLEAMMTFLYRENSDGINWAYPLSLQDTGHEITASTGDRFFAA